MKKTIFMALAVSGMMYSCGGGTSAEDYTKAANDTCGCMDKKTAERGDVSEDLAESYRNMDYAMCALDVAFTGVDPANEDFTKAIADNCATLVEAQAAYLKSNEGN